MEVSHKKSSMKRVMKLLQQEIVLAISGILALLSMCFVKPDGAYRSYIDFRVLGLLFALMAVVGAAVNLGVFDRACRALLHRISSVRTLLFALVLLPFFASMFVTNDVALVTFVPLALAAVSACAPEKRILTVALQTVAANLGSALTPFGNPQNIFLTSFYEIRIGTFLYYMAPVTAAGLFLLALCTLLGGGSRGVMTAVKSSKEIAPLDKKRFAVVVVLFVVCILSVLRVLPWYFTVPAVAAVLFLCDRRAFLRVDYSLLTTFVFFFIFVGNVARIAPVARLLERWIAVSPALISALVSQVVSNVPAALMLSGFTKAGGALLLGTNIGGLGTPIASMASLISLRLYALSPGADRKRYLLVFSILNFILLALLLGFAAIVYPQCFT